MNVKKYIGELWSHRELIFILSWRDIKIRYKQTVLGASWGLIRPLITTIVFTLVFNRIARLQNPSSAPYILMVSAGMIPWQLFSVAVSDAANSIVLNAPLIRKVYFPRLVIPLSSVFTSLIDFAVSFALIIGLMIWYGFLPNWHILFLPLYMLLMLACTLGTSLYLTALNVKYRDFRHLIPFTMQIGLYITPVAFSSQSIPARWRFIYSLNPMAGIVDGFRWCLLRDSLYVPGLLLSGSISLFLVAGGALYFQKMQQAFADNI